MAPGDARKLALVETRNGTVVVVAYNDADLATFALR